MKIKQICLEKFKRFTDLTIKDIPQDVKLVVMLGPNGCGKSSLFDAFKAWHKINAYSYGTDNEYCRKDQNDSRNSYELVQIEFYEKVEQISKMDRKKDFYFRTAYRNSPYVTVSAIQNIPSPLEKPDNKKMIDNDSSVDDNYQRLVSRTIDKIFDTSNDTKHVKDIREEILGKIREAMLRLFPDLLLTEIGLPTEKSEFYFEKGTTHQYGYEKLSGGEKAAFDLLLDMVIKSDFYDNTIFCIDEPETHIHTQLQAKLLRELFNIVEEPSQLWIATHSFGMLKEAKKLFEEYPGQVVFLNFDGYDFDEEVVIEPSECDSTIWNKMLEITLDDYATLLSPDKIVFCEGTTRGRKRKDFDARCYANIFRKKYPNTLFYSLGSCNDIEKDKNAIVEFISCLSPNAQIIRVIDRDDRSDEEVEELRQQGVKVLRYRNVEGYLLNEEVISKWCVASNYPDLREQALQIREQRISESIDRGNAQDDLKSAGNDICTDLKKLFHLTRCGNNGESIMRDTISKLITEDMVVFEELEQDIFG